MNSYERMRQFAADITAADYDADRDREFYEQPDRFITADEIEQLSSLLSESDDPDYDLRMALSEIGIDPCSFSDDDLDAIQAALDHE